VSGGDRFDMHPYSAVIFDMDGVIVDSEPCHERAFREVIADLGYGDRHGIHFPDYYGRSDRALWLDFIERHRPSQPLETLTRLKEDRLLSLLAAEEPVFDDVPELVESLAGETRLAVASGSTHAVISAVLAMRGLRRHFPVVVSAQDVVRGKPEPDIFLLAAEKLGVDPAGCVVIEDSAAGVKAARAAGMRVIGITNSLPAERLAEADVVVSGYREIRRLLLDRH
jgi:HAD superfamily hydrolase (TIGR01509 family)